MKTLKNKFAAIIVSIVMIFLMAASAIIVPSAHAQTAGSIIVPTLAYCNVAPNPCGVGQIVTIGFWLADPMFDSEHATGLSVYVTDPSGTTTKLGTFTADLTGGTFTTYTPSVVGNYSFWMVYAGQQYANTGYTNYYNNGSTSATATLVVTTEPRGGLPDTPLPTTWWQTPVNAENVQLWSQLTGSWLGYSADTFAATGGYNFTGNYNPYTIAPSSSHILWTKVWCGGGVAGGELGNSEQFSSYWGTYQYTPRYAPVIINGIEYSTWYTADTTSKQGILALDLYTGQTLWVINTTSTLRCGMVTDFENINQYGVVGPFIITTGALNAEETGGQSPTWNNVGTEFNIYDGLTGQFEAAIVNGTAPTFFGEDAHGNIIGYGTNSTAGTMYTTWTGYPLLGIPTTYHAFTVNASLGPNIYLWNLSQALGYSTMFNFGFSPNQVFVWKNGVMWSNPMGAYLNGVLQSVAAGAFGFTAWSQNTLVLTTGTVSVAEQRGYQLEAGFSTADGHCEWIYNRTSADTPMLNPSYTRLSNTPSCAAGVYVEINQNSYLAEGFNVDTGKSVWTSNLDVPMADGNMPNPYDSFDFETVPDATTGVLYVWALGGDVWALNMTNGNIIWSWSTIQANGPAGTESPYGTYPLWVFSDEALAGQGDNTVLYLSEGHEYDPPLFHGARELAFNGNTGQLLWSNLGFDDTATAVAYGVMTTINAYDGQVYAYARGPSKTTVEVPQVGVTTQTPITISGTVTDISAGASQPAVAANFPNGLPCVSDDSMTGLMEAAYEQQPLPSNLTGVPITVYVLDSNNNYRSIGTTTSDASGTYGMTWTPDIAGNYTVYAVFTGTHGYYPSSAEAHFYAGAPPATAPPTATPANNLATQNGLMYGIVAIVIVIIIIGAVLAILVTRKHP